ncbi:MAG: ABC transporter permease [Bacteroidota bacterium]
MFDYDKWQEIFESLKKHKLRTLLTAFAVWWGIFMLVILLGAGNGLQNSFEKNFGDDAINSIWLYPDRTSEPHKGLPVGRRVRFDNEDFNLLRNHVEGVEHLTGRFWLGGDLVIENRGKTLSFDVRSVHPDHLFIENTLMREGRYLNESDIHERRKVCVIGRLVKEGFFKSGEPVIGEHITIKGTKFKVVGIFEDEGHLNEMRKIYIPITTAQRIYSTEDRIHQLILTVGDATLEESKIIENNIRQELAAKHDFAPIDKQAVYISNNIEEYEQFQMIFLGIKFFIWFVGIGSIIAGVVGVSNIMLIIVKDRTKEIGIRKAMGATPRSIISMILQEAIFLTGTAGYLGLLCGFGVVYALQSFMTENEIETEFFYNPEVDFMSVLTALIFLVCCGTLAGLIPAIKAVRVNPVTAMRQ